MATATATSEQASTDHELTNDELNAVGGGEMHISDFVNAALKQINSLRPRRARSSADCMSKLGASSEGAGNLR